MEDRMNTVEASLLTDLQAEADITSEFNLIDDFIRENASKFHARELPALVFEILECDDKPIDDDDDIWERLFGTIFIVCENTSKEAARTDVKKYISLVRDFLKSTAWSYAEYTKVQRSGFAVAEFKESSFRSVGVIPVSIDARLTDDTVKSL